MTRKSFSVRIFLQDGHADGVRIVSRSKWSGRGLVIPRAAFAEELGRAELKAPGICLLAGSTEAVDRPALCIGAAEPVCAGLTQFCANGPTWSTAIIFTCKENSLDLPQYQLIAARLLQLARSADRAEIISADHCPPPQLSAVDSAAAENFLDHVLGLYPLFGVNAFDEYR